MISISALFIGLSTCLFPSPDPPAHLFCISNQWNVPSYLHTCSSFSSSKHLWCVCVCACIRVSLLITFSIKVLSLHQPSNVPALVSSQPVLMSPALTSHFQYKAWYTQMSVCYCSCFFSPVWIGRKPPEPCFCMGAFIFSFANVPCFTTVAISDVCLCVRYKAMLLTYLCPYDTALLPIWTVQGVREHKNTHINNWRLQH